MQNETATATAETSMIGKSFILDRLERLWLKWQRDRAKHWIAYHEVEVENEKREVAKARAQYHFWIDRERARGFDWQYDDDNITWKLEVWLTCLGIFSCVVTATSIYLIWG